MRFNRFCRHSLAGVALLVGLLFTTAARACLNKGNLEVCHCVQDMLMQVTRPGGGLANASPAASQSFYVGDSGTNSNYYSKGPNNTGGGIDVTINVGDTITWSVDKANTFHTVTSDLPKSDPEYFDLFLLATGSTGSHTFTHPGTYTYYCTNHDGFNNVNGQHVFFGTQHATVNVVAAPEPGSLMILGIGSIGALLRRRKPTRE